MSHQQQTILIYDKVSTVKKYGRTFHSNAYNNMYTLHVSMKDAFKVAQNIKKGKAAIDYYNSLESTREETKIPEDLDRKLYNVVLVEFVPAYKQSDKNEYYLKEDMMSSMESNDTITSSSTSDKEPEQLVANIILRYVALIVDNERFADFIENNIAIPNKQLLMFTCNVHTLYVRVCNGVDVINETVSVDNQHVGPIVTNSLNPSSDISDPIIQQPYFFNQQYNLFTYQKQTIKWMLDRELTPKTCANVRDTEIEFGQFMYSNKDKKFRQSVESGGEVIFPGGALIDEVGLGKTIQTLTLSLLNPARNINYFKPTTPKLCSRATLILCPNQLCGQWEREITKMIKSSYAVKTLKVLTKVHYDKLTYHDLLDADFVIVSFKLLGNKCFKGPWITQLFGKANYKPVEADMQIIKNNFSTSLTKLKKNFAFLKQAQVNLYTIFWHRLIVDEIHEVFTKASNYDVEIGLKLLESTYRWCLSGTPFSSNVSSHTCLMKMINYSTNYVLGEGTETLNNSNIRNHVSKQYFRRNTKQSVASENSLQPIREEVIKLDFSQTEYMIYNAYLENPNTDKSGVFLRQLCCHPQIADELKGDIENCKTLEDIENKMFKVYEKDYFRSLANVKYIQFKLKKSEQRLKILHWKRQRGFLKKLGYKVEFDYTPVKLEGSKEELALIAEFTEKDVTGLDKDLMENAFGQESDDENDSDDEKELFVISDESQDRVNQLIGDKLNKNIPESITVCEDTIKNYRKNLETTKVESDGKKRTYEFYNTVLTKIKAITAKMKEESGSDSDSDDEESERCPICMSVILGGDLGVARCGHCYCYSCISKFKTDTTKCVKCNGPISKNNLFLIRPKFAEKEKKVDEVRVALVNKIGTKLASMIDYIKDKKNSKKHMIIFSQWDDLLKKVGTILNENGIKNVFCRGNVYQRDKALRDFSSDDSIRVIMLSSDKAASGANLTKAEMVIMLEPIAGTYESRRDTEWQAIGRAHRTGQTKQVTVVRFIVKNTIEEQIYNENVKENAKFTTVDSNVVEFVNRKVEKQVDEEESEKPDDEDQDESEASEELKLPPKQGVRKIKEDIEEDTEEDIAPQIADEDEDADYELALKLSMEGIEE